MKKSGFILFFCLLILSIGLEAQTLSNVYIKSKVTLERVKEYGEKNNWEQIFYDYEKGAGKTNIGKSKSIVVAPDGSVFMTDKTTYSVTKFDKNGNFITRFGQKGGKNGDFFYDPALAGILDNKYVVTYDLQGRIQFFTLDGVFHKLVKIDYMPCNVTLLSNNYIAILGYVPMGNGKSKDIITIKNLETGKEKIIWQKMDDSPVSDQTVIVFSRDMPIPKAEAPLEYSKNYYDPMLSKNKKGDLLLAFSESGEIMQYSKEGVLLKKIKVDIEPLVITKEDVMKKFALSQQQLEKILENVSKNTPEEKKQIVKQFNESTLSRIEKGLYKKNLPYFSSFMVDSDDNLLLFEFSKEKTNQFKIYTMNSDGKSIATTSFECDDYSLSFRPRKMEFNNGFIYAVGILKEEGIKVPLRIVKFELK